MHRYSSRHNCPTSIIRKLYNTTAPRLTSSYNLMRPILHVGDKFLRGTLTVTKLALHVETKKSTVTCVHGVASVHYKTASTPPRQTEPRFAPPCGTKPHGPFPCPTRNTPFGSMQLLLRRIEYHRHALHPAAPSSITIHCLRGPLPLLQAPSKHLARKDTSNLYYCRH